MRFRRFALLIITVLATFGSLMANPAGAIEPWDVTDESECLANGFIWYGDEGYCDYPEWDAEAECIESGNSWNGEWCTFDDGSLHQATNETDCLDRGGAWQQE
ncbi:MAG: hypothetical protein QF844_11600, partial [Acidimicrobiales bacterium]|nr:hypothetical protein [Acidimicrobiales bacterium]